MKQDECMFVSVRISTSKTTTGHWITRLVDWMDIWIGLFSPSAVLLNLKTHRQMAFVGGILRNFF